MMQDAPKHNADELVPYSRFANQRPVVIIEQNQENLDQLITLYLGLADIILVPNAYVGLRMINMFKAGSIEILAIEGLFGCGMTQQGDRAASVSFI